MDIFDGNKQAMSLDKNWLTLIKGSLINISYCDIYKMSVL